MQKKTNALVLSVVSHGHAHEVRKLLDDLARECKDSVSRVILTLNIPEVEPVAPEGGWPFVLDIRRNSRPLGFGANHNRALADADEMFFGVINPDIRLRDGDPFSALLDLASQPGVGCAYPIQCDSQGAIQSFERELPTPMSLLRRRLAGHRARHVDWVNAACLVIPRHVWNATCGFNEAYFMYCEDVDFSLRVRLDGWSLVRSECCVEHIGHRASSRNLQHLWWHVCSLLKLWRSPVFWQSRKSLHAKSAPAGRIGSS
jgi:GT2 family glycosyltransferase